MEQLPKDQIVVMSLAGLALIGILGIFIYGLCQPGGFDRYCSYIEQRAEYEAKHSGIASKEAREDLQPCYNYHYLRSLEKERQ